MFTVSNALLMSYVTAMMRVGGMCWLKPVATVLLMLCSAVFVECFGFQPVLVWGQDHDLAIEYPIILRDLTQECVLQACVLFCEAEAFV